MPLIRRIRSRGVNMVIEANGELLFGPTGPVPGFTRSFSNKARGATIQAAPSNKRPRWAHYGLPLKRTIKASSRVDAAAMKAYAVVGSTAPHAAAVDQGSGIYNGGGPYEAKVLPPWHRESPSLYERSWHPPGQEFSKNPVLIKGQRPQLFFDKGLRAAFAEARMATAYLPVSASALGDIDSVVDTVLGFAANTPNSPAFRAQLEEWRSWRDRVFNEGRELGRGGGYRSRTRKSRARSSQPRVKQTDEQRKAKAAVRSKRYRDARKKAVVAAKPRQNQRQLERTRFLRAAELKYPGHVVIDTLKFSNGRYSVTVLLRDPRSPRVIRKTLVGHEVK